MVDGVAFLHKVGECGRQSGRMVDGVTRGRGVVGKVEWLMELIYCTKWERCGRQSRRMVDVQGSVMM